MWERRRELLLAGVLRELSPGLAGSSSPLYQRAMNRDAQLGRGAVEERARMYRTMSEPSPVETSETGLPMPTFFALLRNAWPKTWSMWLGAASVALLCIGGAIATGMAGLAFFGVVLAVVVGAAATESSFDAWLSWVPDLSAVYSKRELTLWFGAGLVGALVLAMGVAVGLIVALPGELGARLLSEIAPKIVVFLIATVLYGVRTTLRWRYAARVMRTRVASDYV